MRDLIFIILSEYEGITEDYIATLLYADNARFLKKPKFRHALFRFLIAFCRRFLCLYHKTVYLIFSTSKYGSICLPLRSGTGTRTSHCERDEVAVVSLCPTGKCSASVLYCKVLYCTVLYCTTLYYTILYYTALYCTE